MKVKSLLLATSSLLVARNIAEAATPAVQPLEANPNSKLSQTNPSEEDNQPPIIPQVTSPETTLECESCLRDKKKLPDLSQTKSQESVVVPAIPKVASPETMPEWRNSAPNNLKASQLSSISSKKPRELSKQKPLQASQVQKELPPLVIPQITPPETLPKCESSAQNLANSKTPITKYQPGVEPSRAKPSPTCIAQTPVKDPVTDDAVRRQQKLPVIPAESQDPNYINPPEIVPSSKLNTLTTTIPLNGNVINHRTEWETTNSLSFGSDRSTNIDLNAIIRVRSQVEQSLSKDNVFTSDQRGSYVQLQTVKTKREVELLQTAPQTMQGIIIQESFTGPCLAVKPQEAGANTQCTFTPALVTDRNSLDPKFFIPTRINQLGNVGDVISPETLKILSQPGFQNVGANNQVVGLDLYFPNLGATPGNTQSTQSTISRKEDIETTPLLGFSRVRQILKANDNQAVMGRTIRGTGFILGDKNTLLNLGVTAATELLPDAKPYLAGSTNPVNTNINRNLFAAANNTWIPSSSWTVYQAGLGGATHPFVTSEGKASLPDAHFNSIWIGLSPVTKRDSQTDIRYVATGPERVTIATGGEGGSLSNTSFISNINGNSINSADLNNFYTQIYLTFLNRDVNFISTNKLTERTSYYPHIAFTGNITGTNQVFRYYTGVIASESPKVYLGADYIRNKNNWIISASGIGYLNPDQDYSSNLQANITRRIPLSSNANLNLFTGFRYAFNQTSNPLETRTDNYVSVGARANVGPVSVGLTQYFDGVLPNSINTALGVDASIAIGSQARISAYLTPGTNQMSYGAIAEYKFGKDYYSPALVLGWRKDRYDFGRDPFENSLKTSGDTFTILFRMGAPTSAFRTPS